MAEHGTGICTDYELTLELQITIIPINDDNKEQEMDPRRRIDPREEDFEQSEERIQSMLRDIRPRVETQREPGAREQNGPVDDCDEEGKCRNGGGEEIISDQEIEGQTPVAEHGKFFNKPKECISSFYTRAKLTRNSKTTLETQRKLIDAEVKALNVKKTEINKSLYELRLQAEEEYVRIEKKAKEEGEEVVVGEGVVGEAGKGEDELLELDYH
ncbi:hypothetical protein B7494_g24 [Chlorociboria aeruginascens]|nr:hypothetical protein B7494_g24 [Chlorociboria aeruginascens]